MNVDCIHVCVGGPLRTIFAGGVRYTFEDHHYFGPLPCRRNGDELKREPDPRSPFWRAYECWSKQGKRVDGDVCRWVEPPPERYLEIPGLGLVPETPQNTAKFAGMVKRVVLVPGDPKTVADPEGGRG